MFGVRDEWEFYDFDGLLGSGSYAKVYKVIKKSSQEIYAMKIIELKNNKLEKDHKREIYNLKNCKPHENIIKF